MNIGVIGLGTVSTGFIEILNNKKDWIKKKYGTDLKIVAVKDIQKGNMYNSYGINLNELLNKLNKNENIDDGTLLENASLAFVDNIDLIVEATYSDYVTGNPAYTYIQEALTNKKHVITTNKGPIALQYSHLNQIAKKNNVSLRYEGTVLSGTPTFSFMQECLALNNITEVRGIFNGTCNYILSQMAKGVSFDDALSFAQREGYAEADPTNDIMGYDTRGKVAILSHEIFGTDIGIDNIPTIGIHNISKDQLDTAKKEGKNIRLVGSIRKTGNKVEARVEPLALKTDDTLSNINGVTNAIEFTTTYLGKVLVTGPGAGKLETGYSIFSDVLSIIKKSK